MRLVNRAFFRRRISGTFFHFLGSLRDRTSSAAVPPFAISKGAALGRLIPLKVLFLRGFFFLNRKIGYVSNTAGRLSPPGGVFSHEEICVLRPILFFYRLTPDLHSCYFQESVLAYTLVSFRRPFNICHIELFCLLVDIEVFSETSLFAISL